MWEQRAIPQRRWELSRHFDSFEEFVTAAPLDGLHTSVQMLKDVCRRSTPAIDAIDRACQHEKGRPSSETVSNRDSFEPRPHSGDGRDVALRRLRKDRPDLHAKVLDGTLSAHGAMVEAGLRHRTVIVRVTDPRSAAKMLADNMSDEDLAELVRILNGEVR